MGLIPKYAISVFIVYICLTYSIATCGEDRNERADISVYVNVKKAIVNQGIGMPVILAVKNNTLDDLFISLPYSSIFGSEFTFILEKIVSPQETETVVGDPIADPLPTPLELFIAQGEKKELVQEVFKINAESTIFFIVPDVLKNYCTKIKGEEEYKILLNFEVVKKYEQKSIITRPDYKGTYWVLDSDASYKITKIDNKASFLFELAN